MHQRIIGDQWHRNLWRIVSHPTANVVAVLVLMGISTWVVVSTEADLPRNNPYPVPFLGTFK